jgi:HTH-type transcriptional regulator/antitoxin HigA
MEQLGLKTTDLAKILGGRSRVSEVLNRKRNLSLEMMRSLHKHLSIPAESLLG